MVYRMLRIPFWLVAAMIVASITASSARSLVSVDAQQVFSIVTPDISQVTTQDVTPEIAQRMHMNPDGGVIITEISANPLRVGDLIVSINGYPVRCQRELDDQLASIAPGEIFSVEVFRDGRMESMTVRRAPETSPTPVVLPGAAEIRGIRVASLSTANGVMVTNVQIGTPASDTGLREGDIILDVDGHPVQTANEFVDFVRQLDDRFATFNVRHSNGQINVFSLPY